MRDPADEDVQAGVHPVPTALGSRGMVPLNRLPGQLYWLAGHTDGFGGAMSPRLGAFPPAARIETMRTDFVERRGEMDIRRAFESEMSLMVARRVPPGIGLFLILLGVATGIEWRYYPRTHEALLVSYVAYVFICSVQLSVVRLVPRLAIPCTAIATSALAVIMSMFFARVAGPLEILALMLVIFETGLVILYPWGWRGQFVGCVGALVGYVFAAYSGGVSAQPRLYGIACLWIGTGLTIFGAHLIDSHRFASYSQAANLARVNTVMEGILNVFRQMRSSAALPDLLQTICQKTIESFGFARAAIVFRDERTKGTVPVASYGVPPSVVERAAEVHLTEEEALGREELVAGHSVVLTRSRSLPTGDRRWLEATGLHALAMFPLSVGDALRGVMYVGVTEAREFTPEQVTSLEVVAHHAATAILLAHFFRDKEHTAQFHAGLSLLAVRLNAESDRDRALQTLCTEASALFGATASTLLSLRDEALVSVVAGARGESIQEDLVVPLTAAGHVAVRALQERDVVFGSDTGLPDGEHSLPGFRSAVAVPLVDAGHPVVLLVWHATDPYRFGPWVVDEARVFRTLVEGALRNLELVERLAEANLQLREANEAKDRLLASASHDLRTPLSVIIGYSQIALEGGFGELRADLRDMLERIAANASAQLSLVEDLMTLSRLEIEQISIELVATPLRPLLSEMGFVAEGLVRQRPVCVLVPPIDEDLAVLADPARLRQILINLVSNAAKFTETGSIELQARSGNKKVCISIRDTGPGIDPQDHERIFEPFVQLAGSASESGVGLGLAIVRQLAERMGGCVRLESAPGRGATFRVWLPRAPLPPAALGRQA